MSCWARRCLRNSLLAALAALAALALAACGGRVDRRGYEDIRKTSIASLLPPEIALAYLEKIESRGSEKFGESIPPCQLAEKGLSSGGEYRRRNLTVFGTTTAPNVVAPFRQWYVYRVFDRDGDVLRQADLEAPNDWAYVLRTPRNARTLLGTTDSCMVGPTSEPPRRVIEALVALGTDVAPNLAYIVPKK